MEPELGEMVPLQGHWSLYQDPPSQVPRSTFSSTPCRMRARQELRPAGEGLLRFREYYRNQFLLAPGEWEEPLGSGRSRGVGGAA